jgi:hypothetical protein
MPNRWQPQQRQQQQQSQLSPSPRQPQQQQQQGEKQQYHLLTAAGLRSIIKQAALVELCRDEEDEEQQQQDMQQGAERSSSSPAAAAVSGRASARDEDVVAWALRLLEGDSWRSRATVALAGHGKK